MFPSVHRLAGPQPVKLCLEALARSAPVTACSALVDSTPTSIGGVTPARFLRAVEPPTADDFTPTAIRGSVIDTTPTPISGGASLRFHFSSKVDGPTSAWSPMDSPFGLRCTTQSSSQHVRFQDSVEEQALVSPFSPTCSEEREDGKSTGERSFSTCSFVGHLSSNDFSVKNTFIHVDPDGPDSDDDFCIPIQKSRSLPNALPLRQMRYTAEKNCSARPDSDVEDRSPPRPKSQGLPSAEEAAQNGLPSTGAALHGEGDCKPCAFFWKPEGCQNGIACYHCHACPEDEIKRRKKAKHDQLKKAKRLAKERCGQSA